MAYTEVYGNIQLIDSNGYTSEFYVRVEKEGFTYQLMPSGYLQEQLYSFIAKNPLSYNKTSRKIVITRFSDSQYTVLEVK